MKSIKTIILIGVCAVMLGGGSVVHAQTTDELRPAGVTPDNPLFALDRFFERVTLAFTRNEAARARRLAAYTEERAAELRDTAIQNRDTDRARELYEEHLEELSELTEDSEDAEVEEAVADSTSKHIAVLERVRDQVPEEARASIERAIERAHASEDAALNKLARTSPERFVGTGLNAARRRLLAAQEDAREGNVDAAERVLSEFENIFQRVREARQSGDNERVVETAERFSEQMTEVIDELDGFENLPENVRQRIRARLQILKDLAVNDHLEALRTVASSSPERAAELYAEAAERRAEAAEEAAERRTEAAERRREELEERLESFQKYSSFGEQISEIARRLRTGESDVEDVVRRATERHKEILERVRMRAPENAREGLDRAIQNTEQLRERIEVRVREREERDDDGDTATSTRVDVRTEIRTRSDGLDDDRFEEDRFDDESDDDEDSEKDENEDVGEDDRSGQNTGRR